MLSSSLHLPAAVRKATQALNYFARVSASGSPQTEINKKKALKLLFFADRYHLRKYGRTVSDCDYFAMKDGPVASEAKHVAEENHRLPKPQRDYGRRFLRRRGEYDASAFVCSVAAVDEAVLSESDKEALAFAWENFGHYDRDQLVEITHHYPEWKRHERALTQHGKRRVQMECADFLAEPDKGYNSCHPLSAADKSAALALLKERQAIDALWD